MFGGTEFHNSEPANIKLFFKIERLVFGIIIFPLILSFDSFLKRYSGS